MQTTNTTIQGRDPDSLDTVEATEPEDQIELVLFKIGSTLLALETSHVLNVAPAGIPVPVPTAPPAFLGIAVIHGRIYAVADIGPLLKVSNDNESSDTDGRYLVVQAANHQLALLVDRVIGLTELPGSRVQQVERDSSHTLRDDLERAYAETAHGPALIIDIGRLVTRLSAASSDGDAS